ncbi:ShKT domain-containing protein [Strongyloides ratti]|uniref:ShKT domain-containing protein n=1 Tax=Strongyloides ratti TaxID=34506 RepID=A0A090L0V9_STRRB|nr:ShKT domain-containing protein [Strongyloides ratti]CEF63311.1 ShKT domain-containing protein [Strongyloides ratti]
MFTIHFIINFLIIFAFSIIATINITIETSTLTTSTINDNNNTDTINNLSSSTINSNTTLIGEQNVTKTTTTYLEKCEDTTFKNGLTCDSIKQLCENIEYKEVMKRKCPKTCGIC